MTHSSSMTCTCPKSPGYPCLARLTVAYKHRLYVAADENTDWPGCWLRPGQPARLQNARVTCAAPATTESRPHL
ncbi:hypothetical protein VTN02DRAFT_2768 [Thermoascus thermophilus]